MEFSFDKAYYRNNKEGLLYLYFVDLDSSSILQFNNSRFSIINKKFDIDSCSILDIDKGSINAIKENEDMDYLIQINKNIIMKILFFPNDRFSNGVEQIFRFYMPKEAIYIELASDLQDSEDAMIYCKGNMNNI